MRNVYTVDRSELLAFTSLASQSAKRCMEVCGLLVAEHSRLQLIPVHNASQEILSFAVWKQWVQIALRAANCPASRVVGTYHSHPISGAVPGESDIAGIKNGSLMLIAATLPMEYKLWRINDLTAIPMQLIVSQG